jgi:hypothetical protein
MQVTGRSPQEARPERVPQWATGQCEAECIIFVHCVGDEVENTVGVEDGEGGGSQ